MYIILLLFSLAVLYLIVMPRDNTIALTALFAGLIGAVVGVFLSFGGPQLHRHFELNIIVKEIIKLVVYLGVLHFSAPERADRILTGGATGVGFAFGEVIFAIAAGLEARVFFGALALMIMHACTGIIMAYLVNQKKPVMKAMAFFAPVTLHFLTMFLVVYGALDLFIAFIGIITMIVLLVSCACIAYVTAKEQYRMEEERAKIRYIPEHSGCKQSP